ncbi:MAG TPA: cation-transporting P-type ATPase [Streptosporangiaceae bacterium]
MTATKPPVEDVAWYAQSAQDAAGQMGVDPDQGLDADEIQRRLAEYGPNELPTEPPPSVWVVGRAQLANPMNIMLLIVCGASFAIVSFSAVNIGLVMRRERQAPWASPVFPYLGWIILGWILTWAAVELNMLQRLLDTKSLSGREWVIVLALSLIAPAVVGVDKIIQLSRQRKVHDAPADPFTAKEAKASASKEAKAQASQGAGGGAAQTAARASLARGATQNHPTQPSPRPARPRGNGQRGPRTAAGEA